MPDKQLGTAFLLFSKQHGLIRCTDEDTHFHKNVAFRPHRNNRLIGCPYTAKTWKTKKGAQRWLDERTYPADYWTIVEVNLDNSRVTDADASIRAILV